MVIGYFDYFILLLIIVLNYKYWNYNIDATFGCIVYPVLFLALSIASVLVELEITRPAGDGDEIDDSFNHLYVLLKFPVYIALYLLLCIFLLIKRKVKVNSNSVQS